MSNTRQTAGSASGMTLIEVMVALTILAIVSSLVYGGFAQTAFNKRRVEDQLDRYHEARMAVERMARELSMAFVSIHNSPNPALRVVQTAFVGGGNADGSRIDFTSFSHQRLQRDVHESDQNELSYFVTAHPQDSSRKVLARREQARIDDDPRKGGQSQILVDGVLDFELSYLDSQTGQWLKSWDSIQPAMQPNRLPLQVKILLTIASPHRKDKLTIGTRAVLPVTYALNHAVYRR
ncbi:MAG: prepilin-type N-terminal cleavage/methylation domain-containing protein [Proteobacteria bacterium]|nr:prepilin-type N-terminal cleavage/methylation domain-containing protein [Pseudomonadota bacterium]